MSQEQFFGNLLLDGLAEILISRYIFNLRHWINLRNFWHIIYLMGIYGVFIYFSILILFSIAPLLNTHFSALIFHLIAWGIILLCLFLGYLFDQYLTHSRNSQHPS